MSAVVDELSRPQKPGFGFFARPATRSLVGGLAAATGWFVAAALTAFWPDKIESDWAYTGSLAAACGALAVALALAAFASVRFIVFQRLQRLSPWLFVLALFVPLLNILFRYVVAERMGTIILSVIVAHTAWHWMIERFDVLRQFPWPTITAAGLASVLRWLILIVAIAAAAWLVSLMAQRSAKRTTGEGAQTREERLPERAE